MKRLLACLLVLILVISTFIAACSGNNRNTSVTVHIDWVDFIRFNGIMYLSTYQTVPYTEEELEYFSEIKFRVDENVKQPGYTVKDGDAAYLDKGTRIYSIKGYSPDFRLVAETEVKSVIYTANTTPEARTGRELVIYEADTSPNAEKGQDLLDISGKVQYIGINDPVDGKTELGRIIEPDIVSKMVGMVLEAPVDQSAKLRGNQQLFIEFHLRDGTSVCRSFWSDTGKLERGIMLPEEFWKTIQPRIITDFEFEDSQWSLIELNGEELIKGSYISMSFGEGTMHGSSGCNSYGVKYTMEKPGELKTGEGSMTLMLCHSPEGVMDQEDKYHNTLGSVTRYTVFDNKLNLYDADNRRVLVFEQLPEYAMDPTALVGTEWQLVFMNGVTIPEGLSVTLDFDTSEIAYGRASCFDQTLTYEASGDNIIWGFRNSRDGEYNCKFEELALDYTDKLMWVRNYYLANDRLELYTSKGDTLVYEPMK